MKTQIKGLQDVFYDNYFDKVIEKVVKPIKDVIEEENKKEVGEMNRELQMQMEELNSVNVKLTKQIKIHKRRGTAHPMVLNRIQDLIAKETTVSNYLQE